METGVEIGMLCVFLWRFFVVLVVVVSWWFLKCLVGVWSIWVEVGCSGWVAGWWSSERLGWV